MQTDTELTTKYSRKDRMGRPNGAFTLTQKPTYVLNNLTFQSFVCGLNADVRRFSALWGQFLHAPVPTKQSIVSAVFQNSLLSSNREKNVYNQTGFVINWFNSDILCLEPVQWDSKSATLLFLPRT